MLLRDYTYRRGSIVPLAAISLVALMGMIALGVDLGMLAVARTQCQNAADLSALAGTRLLNGNTADNNRPAAQTFAVTVATNNSVLSVPVATNQVTVTTGVYRYNSTAQQFAADFSGSKAATESWTAMQVQINTQQPTYFAQVFGISPIAVGATAVAVHRPRDVAIVLDFSTSMQYGSNVNIRGVNELTTDPTAGSMNPDPNYPQFGPWSIFQASAVAPGSPNPMMSLDGYGDLRGEAHAPSNLTLAGSNGPAMVGDFLCDTTGSGNYVNAFVAGNPASYSASLTPVVTPTPASSWLSAPVDGDRWPLKKGKTSAASPSDYAGCVNDYLGTNKTSSSGPDGTFDKVVNGQHVGSGYDYNPTSGGHDGRRLQGLHRRSGLLRQDVLHLAARPAHAGQHAGAERLRGRRLAPALLRDERQFRLVEQFGPVELKPQWHHHQLCQRPRLAHVGTANAAVQPPVRPRRLLQLHPDKC